MRRRWESQLSPRPPAAELRAFRAHAEGVRERRVELTPSPFIAGVTDISAPVMRVGTAAAALTVPYLERRGPIHSVEQVTGMVLEAASHISDQLIESDGRI